MERDFSYVPEIFDYLNCHFDYTSACIFERGLKMRTKCFVNDKERLN